MGRLPQKHPSIGSLKWTQVIANERHEFINARIREACDLPAKTTIEWVSPVRADEYSEYRDQSFIDRLGIRLRERPLNAFWPSRGPQWDALARSNRGEIFLVESKSQVTELVSPAHNTSSHAKAIIGSSLKETQAFLGVNTNVDWSGPLCEYANRLAHLYLLRTLNRIPAFLLVFYFFGDSEIAGPETAEDWKSPIKVVKGMLGLPDSHRLSKQTLDIFINVKELERK